VYTLPLLHLRYRVLYARPYTGSTYRKGRVTKTSFENTRSSPYNSRILTCKRGLLLYAQRRSSSEYYAVVKTCVMPKRAYLYEATTDVIGCVTN